MSNYTILRRLSEKVIGYSNDYQCLYWQDECECSDGKTRTLYVITDMGTRSVMYSNIRPEIDRPIEPQEPSGL